MAALLISEADFENIKDLIGQHYWENLDLNSPQGYWIPAGLLKTAIDPSFDINPLMEVPNIPIFYGNVQKDRFAYSESITCLCKAREDGSDIKGASILQPYWCEDYCFELKRCFRYHKPNDSERYWRIISRKADIDWLQGYWDEQSKFSLWINQIHL